MNRAIPSTTDGKESPGSERGRSTQGDLRNNADAPKVGRLPCSLYRKTLRPS